MDETNDVHEDDKIKKDQVYFSFKNLLQKLLKNQALKQKR